jgi:hypothetical protein
VIELLTFVGMVTDMGVAETVYHNTVLNATVLLTTKVPPSWPVGRLVFGIITATPNT